jgi:hypothetical protein
MTCGADGHARALKGLTVFVVQVNLQNSAFPEHPVFPKRSDLHDFDIFATQSQ